MMMVMVMMVLTWRGRVRRSVIRNDRRECASVVLVVIGRDA